MIRGHWSKMMVVAGEPLEYSLPVDDERIPLNPFLGKTIRLHWQGTIRCAHCGAATRTSFSQGHCYRCSQTLAHCDMCILKPETCHYARGTCREPEWGRSHCMIEHTVYLANSSGFKVGITRTSQKPTRWMDQGAVQAVVLGTVATRLDSGRVEDALRAHVPDRSNWRKLLGGPGEVLDLAAKREELLSHWPHAVAGTRSEDSPIHSFQYPVLEYPKKVVALNAEKTPLIEGTLMGIKGQYLILDVGVLNVRKYTGYCFAFG